MKEMFQSKTIWEGIVEVFDLHGHPKAPRVYAWAHDTDSPKKRHVTVLHIPPVVSPVLAVRAAIVQEFRSRGQRARKVGRPKLPKGEAMGRIVPVRFTTDALKAMEAAAVAKKLSLSEWIRSTCNAAI